MLGVRPHLLTPSLLSGALCFGEALRQQNLASKSRTALSGRLRGDAEREPLVSTLLSVPHSFLVFHSFFIRACEK